MNVNKDNQTRILEIISQNNGRITTKEISDMGIHRQFLKILVEKGKLIQTSRGIYQNPEILEDELFNLQSLYSKGIFSLETSLFLFNLLERTPFEWTMTFKGNYHSKKLENLGIRIKLCKPELFDLGITEVLTNGNHSVKSYCPERTLCEILRTREKTDIQIITFAFKEYIKKDSKNLTLLMNYSKIFKVENKVRAYLEVLL